jgi:DNA polymerase I-like protein with 3'-5' exonuclease and polymerase domains
VDSLTPATSTMTSLSRPPRDITSGLVSSRTGFEAVLNEMIRAPRVYCDTETSQLGNYKSKERARASAIWDSRVYATGIGIGWKIDGIRNEFYLPWRHDVPDKHNLPKLWLPEFKEIFETKEIVVHNYLYDHPSLLTLGITIPEDNYWDTMVMAHMVNEEFPAKQLDWLAKFVLKDDGKDKEQLNQFLKAMTWQEVPPQIMAPYCCKDVNLTGRLWEVFIRELKP